MEVRRLFDVIHYQNEQFPQKVAFAGLKDGQWEKYSTQQIIDEANKVSLGLLELNVKPGDKIALIVSENRVEWNICDIAIGQIGAINVPIYPTISEKEFEYIFNHAEVKICIASDKMILDKVKAIESKVPTLTNLYSFDQLSDYSNWSELKKLGKPERLGEIKKISDSIDPMSMATMIYTSGTTGLPKGVMLSHNNIISNVKAVAPELPFSAGQNALSFLPLCHIFERMVTYCYVYSGINIYYSEVGTISERFADVRPHFFTTVPRLLEKVYEKIVNKGTELTGLKKKLFFWALDLADQYSYDQKPGLRMKIADKLIFSKWREALGGRVVGIVTGSAPCPLKIARVFSAAGVPIREGYGLSETSPVLTLTRFSEGKALLGTVGIPIDNVELKIAEDGEILAKGPNIMMGYYKDEEKTKEVVSADGWFSTGDIGTFVSAPNGNKFLKITDRKKQLLKTSGGKYVAPSPIENKFKESFFIEQMMVVGEGKKFVSALIVPAFDQLKEYAKEHGIKGETNEELIAQDSIKSMYKKIVQEYNPEFSHIEQIKKFELLPNEWTVDSEELTPTMKVKRKVIREKYAKVIDSIYN